MEVSAIDGTDLRLFIVTSRFLVVLIRLRTTGSGVVNIVRTWSGSACPLGSDRRDVYYHSSLSNQFANYFLAISSFVTW